MNSPRFIHLRLHSEFSITDGIVRLDDAIKRAIQDKMPAVGMSDLMNIFGMVKFYKNAGTRASSPSFPATSGWKTRMTATSHIA